MDVYPTHQHMCFAYAYDALSGIAVKEINCVLLGSATGPLKQLQDLCVHTFEII